MRTSRGMCRTVAVAALLVAAFDARITWSQSLGDVARREQERRTQVTSGRVYTNEDLAKVEPSPSAPAQPATAPEPSQSAPAQEPAARETAPRTDASGFIAEEDRATGKVNMKSATPARPKRDEQYWRTRAKNMRELLAKVYADIAAAEARLKALDAAPQTPATAREREVLNARLTELRADVRLRNDDVAQLRTLAEGAKIPLEWIGAN